MEPTNCFNLTRETRVNIVKATIVIGCLVGFFLNSYLIFVDFIEGSTIISTDLKAAEDGVLMSPSILICGKRSFKQARLDTTLTNYTENSLKLNDYLEFATFLTGFLSDSSHIDVSHQIRSIYTIFYGTCHILDIKRMVISILVYLNLNSFLFVI